MATYYEAGTAANVFGTLGAVCWSVQLLPQIIFNFRRRSTTGLKPSFMLLWASAGCPLAVYNIVNNFNIALIVQPQILTALSLITWSQCCIYGDRKWSIGRLLLTLIPIVLVFAAVQTALIFSCRIGLSRDIVWPTTMFGVLGGVLLCAGVGCEYFEIWKTGGVEGISFLFCVIDAAGDVFSVLSVLFQKPHDYVALGAYAAEFTFWMGIFGCGAYYRLFPWLCSKSVTMRRIQQKMKSRETSARCTRSTIDGAELDIIARSRCVPLQDAMGRAQEMEPRSMSVFRTASSRTSDSLRQRNRVNQSADSIEESV